MSKFVTLLVEDDAFQREILADVLKDEGFEVIECTTAESAELIIASTGTELQALITDHNLAGKMSGAELAQYARRRHPHLNVVIISGTTVNPMPVGTAFFSSRAAARNGSRVRKWGPRSPEIASIHAFSLSPIPCGQWRQNCRPYRRPFDFGLAPYPVVYFIWLETVRDHSPCPIRKAPAQDRVQVLGGN